MVLEGLSLAPFETLDSISEKLLKMAFLLTITSLKKVGDLQALLVASSCLEFAPGRVKAILHPRLGYVPKLAMSIAHYTILQAFHPPPFVSVDQEKLSQLCPARVLETYVHRLPSGVRLTSCWFASVHPDVVPQLSSRQSDYL